MKDEYISKRDTIEKVRRMPRTLNPDLVQYSLVKGMIAGIPAADVAPVVHGNWEGVYQDGACSWSGQCSVCGVRNDIPPLYLAHYCPNCGAKMDGGQHETD